MPRSFDRSAEELRPVRFTRHYTRHAEGSVLVEMGETRVLSEDLPTTYKKLRDRF